MFDLGYQHGKSGSACPSRIGNAKYRDGFVLGWTERNALVSL